MDFDKTCQVWFWMIANSAENILADFPKNCSNTAQTANLNYFDPLQWFYPWFVIDHYVSAVGHLSQGNLMDCTSKSYLCVLQTHRKLNLSNSFAILKFCEFKYLVFSIQWVVTSCRLSFGLLQIQIFATTDCSIACYRKQLHILRNLFGWNYLANHFTTGMWYEM